MSSGSDLTKKIIETKRQTEELKNQLQNLIDNGKNVVCPSHSKQNLITNEDGKDENLLTSQNKVQILKSYDKHSNINSSSIPADKTDVILVSPKKTKAYDVNEAREYMKKQKERLLVKQKQAQEEQKIKSEIQKKKLQELSKKCKELLVKNVKSRREKSKSSDRSNYVRPDESSNIPTNLRRAISLDRVDTVSATQRNPNLLYPPEPHFNKYSLNKKKSKEVDGQIVILAGNSTRPGEDNVTVKSKKGDISCTKNIKTNIAKIKSNSGDKKIDQIENSPKQGGTDVQSKDKISLKKNSSKIKNLEITVEKNLKPSVSFNSHEENRIIIPGSAKSSTGSVRNILEYRSSNSSKSPNVDNGRINSPTILQANGEVAAIENKKPLEPLQSAETKVALNEKDKETINKCSVEIQTETSNKVYPKWLDEQPPQAYPFNFINTIKRKLQFANVQEPVIDIGIQSSVPAHHGEKIEIIETSKSPESKTVKRSDLRSFISHKCLNLDPRTIQHLELVSNKNFQDPNTIFRNLQTQTTLITETESESDTSKNIPEISSESGTSLKKNAESVRKAFMSNKNPSINTDRIDNMKLGQHKIATNKVSIRTESELPSVSTEIPSETKSTETVRSKSQYDVNTLSVDNRYIADFDSDIDLSSESPDRSRRSIISCNRSGYNQVFFITSPEIEKKNSLSKSIPDESDVNTEMILSKSLENVPSSVGDIEPNDIESPLKTNSSYSKYEKSTKKLDKNIRKDEIQTNLPKSDEKTTSSKNYSAHTETRPSSSIINSLSKSDISLQNINTHRGSSSRNKSERSDISLQNINTQRGSSSRNKSERSEIPPLIEPAVSLVKISNQEDDQDSERRKKIVKNISVRSSKMSTSRNTNDANQIHLKFEAEIHLLNDFNQSLRTFSKLEQALETLKTNNNITTSKILQHNDTPQTSLTARSKTSSKISENVKTTHSETSKVNYSRGSFINTSLEDLNLLSNTALDLDNDSVISTGLEINSINHSVKADDHLSNFENLQSVNFAGLSINMFEQLIKDEDVRLENLKTILKIREQALLDRTKGELSWLEIQRKHFKETGHLHEASVIKKKQRGILVNHQKEKHEMQRLKQMQKAASIERKIVLKEQRNLIRQQLFTDNMITKMKVNTPRERRLSGPLKVLQSHTESIRSETSISRRGSSDRDKDRLSVTSHHSIVSEISEIEISSKDISSNEHRKFIKKTLLLREAALKKRRKSAEDLLEWHKKLLEEEKRITVLESTASAIISQKPTTTLPEKFNFKGSQLNQLWFNLTDSDAKKFVDDKIYPMSQIALERFCKSAREFSNQTKTVLKKNSDNEIKTKVGVSENVPRNNSEKDYMSDFENESIATQNIDVVDQSIDILINNFNKIQDDISTLSIIQTKKSDDITAEDKTESEADISSVIETNRTDVKDQEEKTKNSSSSAEEVKETINDSIPTIDQDSSEKSKSEEILEAKSNEDKPEETESEDLSHKLKPLNNEQSVILSDQHSTQKSEHDISEDSAKTKDSTGRLSQKSKSSERSSKFMLLTEDQSVILSDQHSTQKSEDDISEDSAKTKDSTGRLSQKSKSSQKSAKLKLLTDDHSIILSDQHSTQKSEDDISEDSAKTKDSTGRLSQKSKSSQKSAKLKLLTDDQSIILSDQQSTRKSEDDISEDSAKTKDSTERLSQKSKSSQKYAKLKLLTDDQTIILSDQHSTQKSEDDISDESAKTKDSTERLSQKSKSSQRSAKLKLLTKDQSIILSDHISTQKSEDDIFEDSAKTKDSTGRLSQKSKSSQKSAKLQLLTNDQSIILSDQHSTQKSVDDISEDSAKTKDSTGRLSQKSKSSQKSAKLKLLTDDQSIILSDQHSTQKSEDDMSEDSAKTKDSTERLSQKSKYSQKYAKLKLLTDDQTIILSDQHSTQKSEDDMSEDSAKTKDSTGRLSQKSKSAKKYAKLKLLTDDQTIILSDQHSTQKSEDDISEESAKTKDSTERISQNSKSLQRSAKLKLLTKDQSIILSDHISTQKSEDDISEDSAKTKDSTGRLSQKSKSSQRSAKLKLLTKDQSIILSDHISTQKSDDSAKTDKISPNSNSSRQSTKTDHISIPLTDSQRVEDSAKTSSKMSKIGVSENISDPILDQNISEKSKSLNQSLKLKLSLEEDISVPLSLLESSEDLAKISEEQSFKKSKSGSSKIPLSSSHRSTSHKSKSDGLSKNLSIDSDPKISEKSKSLEIEKKVSKKSKSEGTSIKYSKSQDTHDKQDQSRSERIDPSKDSSKIKYSSELSSSKQQINEERDTLDDGVPTISSNSSLLEEEDNNKDAEEILLQDTAGEEQEKQDDEELPPIANETKENLNESQEILLMLGESEIKTSSDEEIPHIQIKDSLNTSQEILSKLENIATEEKLNKSGNSDEDLLSQSFLKLYQISNLEKRDASGVLDISSLEDCNKSVKDRELEETSDQVLLFDFCSDLVETNVDETFEDRNNVDSKEITSEIEDKSEAGNPKSNLTFKIDENNENQTFLNNLVASSTIISFQQETHDDSDESKLALSDKSNESFVINEINEDSNDKTEEQNLITSRDNKTDEYNEESESSKMTSHFSYGVLERNEEKETSDSFETDVPASKEEVNSFEEKEHDSLSSPNDGSSSEALNLEEQSLAQSESSKNEEISKSESRSLKDSISEEISPKDIAVDVKKRVSEILADTTISRGDKSPRLQDLYVTTYDLISPANSPEKDAPSSPKEEHKLVTSIFDSEAEEILRKQLAVEEEIKAITEQQQKEQQLPLMYIREIPNKPPPPYTPPSSLAPVPVPTIIPTSDEIEEITMYSAKILHKAYLSNNLANVNISNNTLSLISKDITKDCYKFVFDLCKDIAREHYKQFEEDKSPSWLRISKKPELTLIKPLDTEGLKTHMIEKLKEVFGYRKRNRRENTIIKWSRKKRDHVDEILVNECQQEEAQWTNYQKDELLVKDQITNEIFDSLLNDTADIFKKIFLKKS